MTKNQILARLIERDSSCRQWALDNGYQPRTVYQVISRWAGAESQPCGRLSFRILRELSQEIGQEIVPGILSEAA